MAVKSKTKSAGVESSGLGNECYTGLNSKPNVAETTAEKTSQRVVCDFSKFITQSLFYSTLCRMLHQYYLFPKIVEYKIMLFPST